MKHFHGLYKRGRLYWFTRQSKGVRSYFPLRTDDLNEALRRAAELAGESLASGDAPLVDWVAPFLQHKRNLNRYTAASVESKGAILRKFARFAECPPAKVTSKLVHNFYQEQLSSGLSTDTAASYLATVRAFFRWCCEVKKICRSNPCHGLQIKRVTPRARRDFCPPHLVEKLLAECPREDLKFVLFCGFHAGLRKQEIIEAKALWFDLANRQIHLRKHERIQFKDKEERSLPMTDQFAEFLINYGLREPYMLHPEVKHGRSLYRYDFERYFRRYMTDQGCQHVTTHIMRHTFASLLASARREDGGPANDIFEIAVWLGDDVRVVQKHYAKLLPVKRDVGQAFRSMPGLSPERRERVFCPVILPAPTASGAPADCPADR